MVKIYRPLPPGPTHKPQQRTTAIEAYAPTHKEQQAPNVVAPFIERRKSGSDRRAKNTARGKFDMRCGRDRRKKSGPYPSVEIDV